MNEIPLTDGMEEMDPIYEKIKCGTMISISPKFQFQT